jgi:hypothetical protein
VLNLLDCNHGRRAGHHTGGPPEVCGVESRCITNTSTHAQVCSLVFWPRFESLCGPFFAEFFLLLCLPCPLCCHPYTR